MAQPAVPEAEVRRLIQTYRKAVKDLAERFVGDFSIEDNRVLSLVRDATKRLEALDKNAAAWAKKNVAGIYEAARKETAAELVKRGLSKRTAGTAGSFAVINHQAIEALVLDPELGFLSTLTNATDGVRNRLKLIHNQAQALRSQQRVIDDVIARVGILEGSTVDQVKHALVKELTSSKNAADLVWKPKLDRLGPRHIFANLANLPYVRTPTGRNIRLDRYAELVARTKSRQATGVAQRNALLEHGRDLVMISRNQSQDDDACNLYVGRVFALTQEAAERDGVPHVDELPGGGAPFHPNCTHNEIGFFPELMRKGVTDRAMTSPPAWALNSTWGEVQREYVRRGGNAFGMEQNPNMATAQDPGGRQRKIAAREAAEERAEARVRSLDEAKGAAAQAKIAAKAEAQARKDAEALAKAEAKARAEAEAQAKAEAAAALAAEEARARAETETLAAEAAQEKAEGKMAKAEVKAEKALSKAEQKEADAKLDAEFAKEEEEARKEAEAEMAKARAQFEQAEAAQKKAEAEAKAAQEKSEAEEKARKEAEQKFEEAERARKLAEEEAAAAKEAQAEAEAAKEKAEAEAKAAKEAQEKAEAEAKELKELEEAHATEEFLAKEAQEIAEAKLQLAKEEAEAQAKIDKMQTLKAEMEAEAAKKAQEEAEFAEEKALAKAEAAELDAKEIAEEAKAAQEKAEAEALEAQQLADDAALDLKAAEEELVAEKQTSTKAIKLLEDQATAEFQIGDAKKQIEFAKELQAKAQKKIDEAETKAEKDKAKSDLKVAEDLEKKNQEWLEEAEGAKEEAAEAIEKLKEDAEAKAEALAQAGKLDVEAEAKKVAEEKKAAEEATKAEKNKEFSLKLAKDESEQGIEDAQDSVKFWSDKLKTAKTDEDEEIAQAKLKLAKESEAKWKEALKEAEAAIEEFEAEKLAKLAAEEVADKAKAAKEEADDEAKAKDKQLSSLKADKNNVLAEIDAAQEETKFWSAKLKAAKTTKEEDEAKAQIKAAVKAEFSLKKDLQETEAAIDAVEAQKKIAQEKADLAAEQAEAQAKVAAGEEAFLPEGGALQLVEDLKAEATGVIPPSQLPKEYKIIRKLPGSTNPNLVEDPNGKRWVAKKVRGGDPTDRLWNEVDADRAYAALEIPTPKSGLASVGGELHKFSEFLDDAQPLGEWWETATPRQREFMRKQIRQDFVADALFGNWDVIGLDKDNILIKDNVPYRVDNGGALMFRAQGAPKGDAFGPIVTELRTLLDKGINPQTAEIFGGITDAEIAEQTRRLVRDRNRILDAIQEPRTREIINQRIDYLEQTILKVAPKADAAAAIASEAKIDQAKLDKVFAEEEVTKAESAAWYKKLTDDERELLDEWKSTSSRVKSQQSGVDSGGHAVVVTQRGLERAKIFEDAIAKAPRYEEGRAFRGLYLDAEAIEKLRKTGATWAEHSNASWSSSVSAAKGFAGESVLFDVVKLKNGAKFGKLGVEGEFEVVSHKDALFKVINVEVKSTVIGSAPKPSVLSNEFWFGLDDMPKEDALRALKTKYDELTETALKLQLPPGTEAARRITEDKEAILGAYRRIDTDWQARKYFHVTLEQVN